MELTDAARQAIGDTYNPLAADGEPWIRTGPRTRVKLPGASGASCGALSGVAWRCSRSRPPCCPWAPCLQAPSSSRLACSPWSRGTSIRNGTLGAAARYAMPAARTRRIAPLRSANCVGDIDDLEAGTVDRDGCISVLGQGVFAGSTEDGSAPWVGGHVGTRVRHRCEPPW
jgi:hypothetical protein